MRSPRRSLPSCATLVSATLAALALACSSPVRTDTLVQVFNGGLIDTSNGDPFRDEARRRADIATRVVKQELLDAFFAQGREHGLPYQVGDWLENASLDAEGFYALAVAWACDRHVRIGEACPAPHATGPTEPPAAMSGSRAAIRDAATRWMRGAPISPVCTPSGRDDVAASRFADAVRFEAAIERAVPAIGELLIERLVDRGAVLRGAERAFREAAGYAKNRRWHRELGALTTGLVVKGGASTGVYSAGVVWVALRLIDRCMKDPTCSGGADLRLSLMSGTSTGALVAAAVDMFNSGAPGRDHQGDLDNLAYWFTCKATPDLYCVQPRSAFALAVDQRGLVRFDGIEDLLSENLACEELDNRSELIANAVDFRSGALFAFSDQDPSEMRSPRHAIDGVLASALLPFVGNPVDYLPWAYDGADEPDDPRLLAAFLDGGVRSELPVLPLARRGAERVLVVSSAASVLSETGPLDNAAEILARYIDVSTGGVTESELGHAQRFIESARLREVALCEQRAQDGACSQGCDLRSLCEAHYARMCDPGAATAVAPAERASDRLHRYWRMTSFFRDELAVTPSKGYAFQRGPHRNLFHAGAEAARVRCLELARTLGVAPRDRPLDPALRKRIVDWCSEPLPAERVLCRDEPPPPDELPECRDPAYGPRNEPPSSPIPCAGGAP